MPRLSPPSAGWPVAIFLCGALALSVVLAFQKGWVRLPPNSLPWQAPDLSAPPGLFSHWQIAVIARDPAACHKVLSTAGLRFTPLKNRRIDDRCGFKDVVAVEKPLIPLSYGPTATCGLAAALTWYQNQLQPIAERVLHTRIVRIDQLGTFACRNVNSESTGSRSQHATANAIDIAAFRLKDGRVITVARDWGMAGASGEFLRQAHAAACDVFTGVLGPDYNRLHAGHFHLDLGPYRICR